MDQVQYAKHRGKTKQYVNQLVHVGVLVMRGTKIRCCCRTVKLDEY